MSCEHGLCEICRGVRSSFVVSCRDRGSRIGYSFLQRRHASGVHLTAAFSSLLLCAAINVAVKEFVEIFGLRTRCDNTYTTHLVSVPYKQPSLSSSSKSELPCMTSQHHHGYDQLGRRARSGPELSIFASMPILRVHHELQCERNDYVMYHYRVFVNVRKHLYTAVAMKPPTFISFHDLHGCPESRTIALHLRRLARHTDL